MGGIHRLVMRIDERYGSFFISRLILMTGIKLRSFESFTPDDPELVSRLLQALSTLIPPDEVGELLAMLPPR